MGDCKHCRYAIYDPLWTEYKCTLKRIDIPNPPEEFGCESYMCGRPKLFKIWQMIGLDKPKDKTIIENGTFYADGDNTIGYRSVTVNVPGVIEDIFVNKAKLPIVNKGVNITVPTKASDVGAAEVDHNHDGIYLRSDEKIPESLLPESSGGGIQESVIEIFKVAGEVIPIEEKSVDIPVASATSCGVVKSSSGANQVNVADDGTMRVDVVSTSSIKVPVGEYLILNGGSADDTNIGTGNSD